MRTLKLVSPEMRGEDIRNLQHILNERLAHYKSRRRIKANGVYDRETAQAVRSIGYTMGINHEPPGSGYDLERIEHPHLRNPVELHREKVRAQERQHGSGLEGVVAQALRHVGVHEIPAGSNWGEPYPADWEKRFGFGSGVSWCGCFAGSMVLAAGGHVTSRVAFCPYIEADARTRTNGFDLWRPNHNEGVEPGWLVLYNWNGGSEPEHVGVVKSVHPGFIETVEGNTGGTNPSDGGMVAIQQRPYNFVVGYARPHI